ncbi:uncharacterized protein fam83ha [Genypterus blacodes]|uniref:uncharacterized protein fam83ha n=1 Tax=Genypterus blacodes TaxID=154954 RepID=UPI003F76B45C
MAHRSQCSSAGDNPLDPNYLPPHYREDYRLAIDALVEENLDGYYQFLQKADVVAFLGESEIEYIQSSVKLPQQHSNNPEHLLESEGDGSSDTYWPVHSDVDAPGLDLGWPQVHLFNGPTEVTTLVNPPEADMPSIKEQARRLIKNAQQVIAVVMDMFTDVDIFSDILDAAMRNVAVYIVLDDRNVQHFVNMLLNCRINLDSLPFLRVRTVSGITYHCRTGKSFKGQMMDRFLLTDCRAVLSGNYSFMWSFEKIHRCMAHLFLGELVSTFDEEFRILYAQSEPLIVENQLAKMELNQEQKKQHPSDRPPVHREPQKFLAMEATRPEDLPRHHYDVGMDMDWKKLIPHNRHEPIYRKLDQGPVDLYNRFSSQQSRLEPSFDQGHPRMPEMEDHSLRQPSFGEGAPGRLPSLQFLQQQGRPEFENQGKLFHRGQQPYLGTGPEPDNSSYDKFWNQGYNIGEQFHEPGLPQEREPSDNFDLVRHYLSSTANVDFDQGSEKMLPAAEVPFSSPHPKRLHLGKPNASQNSPTPSNTSDHKQYIQEPIADRKDPVVKRGLRNWRISSYLSAYDNAEDEGLPLPPTQATDPFEEPSNPIQPTVPGIDISVPKIPNTREFKIPTLPRASQMPMYAKPTTREPSKKLSDEVVAITAEFKTMLSATESQPKTEDNKPEETESKELKNAAYRKDETFRRNYNAAVHRSSRLRSSLIFSSQMDQQDSKTAPGQQDEEDDKTKAGQTKLPFASQVLNQRKPLEWGRYMKSASFDVSTTDTSKPDDSSGKAKDKDSTKEENTKLSTTGDNSTTETSINIRKAADRDSTKEKDIKQPTSFGKSATQTSKPDDASGQAAEKDSTKENKLNQTTSSGRSDSQTSRPDEVDGKSDDKDSSREKVSKDLSENRDLQGSVKLADAEKSMFLPFIPQLKLPQFELPIFDQPAQLTKPFFLDMNDPDQRLTFFKELAAKRKAANAGAAEKRKPVMSLPSQSKDGTAVKNAEPVLETSSQNKKTPPTSSETVSEQKADVKDTVETIFTEASGSLTRGADVNAKTKKQQSHSNNDPYTPQSCKEEQTTILEDSDKTGMKDSKSGLSLPVSADLSPPQSQTPPKPKLSNPTQKEGSSSVPQSMTDAATAPKFPSLIDSQGRGTAKNESQTLDSTSKESSCPKLSSSKAGRQDTDSKSDINTPKSCKTEQTTVLTTSDKTEAKKGLTGKSPVSAGSAPPRSQPSEQAKLSSPAIKECIVDMPSTMTDATPSNLPSLTDSPEQVTAKNESETPDSIPKESSCLNVTSSKSLLEKKATAKDAGQIMSTEVHGSVSLGVEVNTKTNKQDSDSKSDPNPPKSNDEEKQTTVSANSEKTKVKNSQTGAPLPNSAALAPPLSQTPEQAKPSSPAIKECIINAPPTTTNATAPNAPSLIDSQGQGTTTNESQNLDPISKDSFHVNVTPSETLFEKTITKDSGQTVSTEAHGTVTLDVDVKAKAKNDDIDSKSDPNTPKNSDEEKQNRISTNSEKTQVKTGQTGASLPVSAETAPMAQLPEQTTLSSPATKECSINVPPTITDATLPNFPSQIESTEQGTANNENQTIDSSSKDLSCLNVTSSETLSGKNATAKDVAQTLSTEAHGTLPLGVEADTKTNKQDSDSKSDPTTPQSSEEQTKVSTISEKTEVKKGQTGASLPVSAELSQQSEEPKLPSDLLTSSNSIPPQAPSLIESVGQHTDEKETQALDSTSKRSSSFEASSPGSILVKKAGKSVSTEVLGPANVSVDVSDKNNKQDTHSKDDGNITHSCEVEQTIVSTHSEQVEVKKDQTDASLPVESAPSLPITSESNIENLGPLQLESSTSTPVPSSDSKVRTDVGSESSASQASVAASSSDHTLTATSLCQSRPSPSSHGSAPPSTPVETISSTASQEHSSSASSSSISIPTSVKTDSQESASIHSSESSQFMETTSKKSVPPIKSLSDSTKVRSGSQLTSSETSLAVDLAPLQCTISPDTRADDSEPNAASTQSAKKTDSSSVVSSSEKDPSESVCDSLSTNATGGSEVSNSNASASPKDVEECVSHTSTPSNEPPDQIVTPVTQTDPPPEHSLTETNSGATPDLTSEPLAPTPSPSNTKIPLDVATEVIPPSDHTRSGSSTTIPPVSGSSSASLPESDVLVVSPKKRPATNTSTIKSPLETTSFSKLAPSDPRKSPDKAPPKESSSTLIEPTSKISPVPPGPNVPVDAAESVPSESQASEPTAPSENNGMENHCEMSKGSDPAKKNPEDAEGKNKADKSTKKESVSYEKPSDKTKQSYIPEQIPSGEVAPLSQLSKQPKTTQARKNSTANVLSSSNLRDDTKLLLGQISANSQSRQDSTKKSAVTDDQKGDEADRIARREKERHRRLRGQSMNPEEREKLLEKIQCIRKENKVYSRFQMAP